MRLVLSPKKWIETTNAIGLLSKSGRYGGTFAHKDIAFEFATWVSVEFKLFLIKCGKHQCNANSTGSTPTGKVAAA